MTDTENTKTVLFEELATACGRFVGRVVLNSPRTLNALSLTMIEALETRLDDWQSRADIVAIWLEGSGEKALCAGGDILALHQGMVEYADRDRNPFVETYFAAEYRLDHRLHTFPKPVICWAEGLVMGGGMGVMQGSHFRLVCASSRLAMPEVTIGLFPDVGASWFLNRLPGKSGLFLGLTGAHVNARDAIALGLADRYMSRDRDTILAALAETRFGDEVEDNRAIVFHRLKELAASPDQMDSPVMDHLATINTLCDAATVHEAVDNILAGEHDDRWLQKAQKTLTAGCPQTIHLIWEQLRRGRHLSLADVFRMEWCMAAHCGTNGDFREGIRALLIDKDGKPQFRHQSVQQVPDEYIASYFQCPAPEHPLADL